MLAASASAAMAVTEVIVSTGTEVAWAGFVFAALFAAVASIFGGRRSTLAHRQVKPSPANH
jgi:hypothetical protein